MNNIIYLISNILIFILLGYLVRRVGKGSIERYINTIINVALYFFIPYFFLVTMWVNQLNILATKNIVIVAVSVIFIGGMFALLFSRIFKMEFRQVCLPIMFMNSAYLAIPVNTMFFGDKGTTYAIVYNAVISFIHFTLGIYLINRERSIKEVFKIPIFYAVVLGIVLNACNIAAPEILIVINNVLKGAIIAVMLALVGYQIDFKKLSMFKAVSVGVVFRFGAGFITSLVLVKILQMTGVTSGVAIVSSSMPSAINTYVLAKKYDANPEFASVMILVSTLVSLVVIAILVGIF